MNTTRLVGLLLVTVGLTAAAGAAQTVPTPIHPAPSRAHMHPRRQPDAAFALRIAYRSIGAAEARGAGGKYLDAARAHYRSARGKATTAAAAAAHEAVAAAALARAAIDEHPIPAPRDLPAPPALPARAARPGPRQFHARGGGHFDPQALARDATLENTPEVGDLAKAAVDADVAAERAEFSGNRDEGMRQHRLARDLAMAVRQLAGADHPQPFPGGQRRRPLS